MSLKEKVKNVEILCAECEVFRKTRNLANRALICETARACGNCLMIKMLENVQKEIGFQKARVDVANEMVASKQKRIDELKQKLQQFREWLSRRKLSPCKNPHEVMSLTKEKFCKDFDREVDDILRKFEELLKEEKEAKTT